MAIKVIARRRELTFFVFATDICGIFATFALEQKNAPEQKRLFAKKCSPPKNDCSQINKTVRKKKNVDDE